MSQAPCGQFPLKFNMLTHHNWRMETVGDSFAALGTVLAAQLPGQPAKLPVGTKLAVAAGQAEGDVRVKLLQPWAPAPHSAATQAAAPRSAATPAAARRGPAAPRSAVAQAAAASRVSAAQV